MMIEDEGQRVWAAKNGYAKPNRVDQLETCRRACQDRLVDGEEEYGDRSFSSEPEELLGEIQQELEDVANWSFIMWVRIQALRDVLRGRHD